MTKKEFIAKYCENGGFVSKAEAERKLNALLDTIENILVDGNEVNFIGWGKWEVVERAKRKVRNPQTGRKMTVKAKKVVKFKPGKKLVDKIAN
ncbi:HU family DNA-binding protein [Ilyobacter polytropus]|uniref:Histone family protein DNA-binding protein n=1 Tax=Ilyobacter polytropus (strain ATCC 51220 / DSM 2926 / LMG 16218 / CuHBu1) TaxID=572544 RepID=E3HDF4_ILYPC|nr:HU family DNA-binding protein [Ilyobacter polytropus]ADO84557.1 histone family protein DNA-binding protein [Ilyobacter polytropus DSM 2926]